MGSRRRRPDAGPPREAVARFDALIDGATARVRGQVGQLFASVTGLDDAIGWDQLTNFGPALVMAAQADAIGATEALMAATLTAHGVPAAGLIVPITPGTLGSGRDVRGLFAVTRGIVAARVDAGAKFPEAMAASAGVVVASSASEPARIGRDGQLEAGLHDERFNRFRRVAERGACDFCRMLATRGAVYLTEVTAGKYRRYHLHDRCRVDLVVDPAAIEASKSLASDWHNAIRDDERLRAAGAMGPPSGPPRGGSGGGGTSTPGPSSWWEGLPKLPPGADPAAANPKRGQSGYSENCTRCVAAHELRVRGYDVTAANLYGGDSTARVFDALFGGGSHRAHEVIPPLLFASEARGAWKRLGKKAAALPDGARLWLNVHWKPGHGGSGYHVFCARVSNGKLRFIDPQTNRELDLPEAADYVKASTLRGAWRVDDAALVPGNPATTKGDIFEVGGRWQGGS